jgi:hypothetical protein
MKSTSCSDIHRIKYSQKGKATRKSRETRAMLGYRFKILLADAGLTPDSAGKLLHVTPRTIRYWISGKVTVPYAAYKLVRVMRMFELPMPGWEGWHMHSGKLWTPEGHGFKPHDSAWWALLCRRSHMFAQMIERDHQFAILLRNVGAGSGDRTPLAGERAKSATGPVAAGPRVPTSEAGRAAQPPGLDLSLGHFGTYIGKNGTSSEEKHPTPNTSVSTNKKGVNHG